MMKFPASTLQWSVLLAAFLLAGVAVTAAQTPARAVVPKPYPPELIQSGGALFRQDCSFCHGRDAGGGESGPDLTRSKLVTADIGGDKIGGVVRDGRLDKGMPRFAYSDQQIAGVTAFIHTQQSNALNNKGRRKGVDVADLQTGNAAAGKQYFDDAGRCATCHSPTGDLAGIASRHQGLELEKRMLYPEHAKSRVTVTIASGQTVNGVLAYLDEFTVGLIDATGTYQSWRTGDVQYKVDSPADAHVELFGKYTDADIHNLMAYLQTLR